MIGSVIGNYRVIEKLGEGGMGVVYKGVDTQLERPVAVKVLSTELSRNPELVERFRAEARAQANLNHTNLATLYAFLVQEGTAAMVMEFVDGETFDQMIRRRGPVPSHESIPLFKQALLGIGAAHRMGIIHRDIKPSNLMLRRDGIVKVMDFGIAKVLGTRGLTRTGMQMGTVSYMSPEQIQNRPVDIRSDIYSLGVTLYELLSGHLPFESDSDFQVMHDHVNTPPPLPTRFYPYIPKGIENVVLRALEKHPDARFQTVEEFGAALEHPDSIPAPVHRAAVPPQARATVLDSSVRLSSPEAPMPPGPPVSTPAPTAGAYVSPTASAPSAGGIPLPGTVVTAGQPAEGMPVAHRGLLAGNRKIIAAGAAALLILAAIAIYESRQSPPPPAGTTGSSSAQSNAPSSSPGSNTAAGGEANIPVGETGGEASAPSSTSTPPPQPSSGSATPSNGQSKPVAVPYNRLRLTRRVAPTYPADAARAGVAGEVVLKTWIDENGHVQRLEPVSGNRMLLAAAESAVQSWQFEPYVADGHPVSVVTNLPVDFQGVQAQAGQQPPQAQANPQQAAVEQYIQSASAAFQAGHLIEPVDNNAIYFSRQARQIDPNNATALNLEQRAFSTEYQNIQSLLAGGNTQEASRQLTLLMQYFPNQASLTQLQSRIQQARPPQTMTPQPGAAAAGNFVTPAYHRHRLGSQISYCEGILEITPQGMLIYNCRVAHDALGCHNVSESLAGAKKVNVFTEGQFAVLHLDKGITRRWDFYAPANVYGAMSAALHAAERAR